ncbi:bifunctional aminoglycoside phosphotransferase/ATP-binding protein [Tropicimonas sp. IMCC6043]|uniref:bifunctional aminoglycoside phosphotransferase/ATP-binding protein n=1 Tax=Tropicimonas sp. IMCC6043 TaxID=2510645 RepID=UPI00101DBBB9|nr:bifunctional aminoglycoside phosphotransferase/ATP-binding protein [Tropicimonas sp. IMCC6043]RYH07026.1 aminoglycoside phosphotransferase [Tropicimonas sp. IMCC6043]
MIIEDQSQIIAFLSDTDSHGGVGPVEVIQTHISAVFLVGRTAYKLKKAVHLPYVDFSTAGIRLAGCEKEVALNRATTPELYHGVRRITREPRGLAFDGAGALVDAVVEMERFPQDGLFDELALRGELTRPLLVELVGAIVSAHAGARVIRGERGSENVAAVLDINRAGFGESKVFDAAEVARIDDAFREGLKRHAPLLDARGEAGAIRLCHGDLHLRNVCLFRGRPTLFDCIDFNDRIATVDILYDLSYLAMDLWHRELQSDANFVINRYLDMAGQEDGVPLLPYFTALRAAVRAHVTATQAAAMTGERGETARVAARAYYDRALDILTPRPARLVAIGGLSGSGKSTIAEALAPWLGAPPGARLLESDHLRKAMFRTRPEERLPEQAYASGVSDTVYADLAERTRRLLEAGCTVVTDAVYDRPERRAELEKAAEAAGVPFVGIWLEADPALLRQRVSMPRDGVSDATVEVLEAQLARDTGPIRWARVPTTCPLSEALSAINVLLSGGRV